MRFQNPLANLRPLLTTLGLCTAAMLAIWVVFSTLFGALAYTYPSLFWDQWDLYRSLLDYQSADSFWTWLFVPHNGHRITLTRLLFLMDLHLTGGSNLLPVLLMFVGQAVLAVGIGMHAWQQLRTWQSKAIVSLVVWLLLFSATQLENFTWSFQTQFIGVFLFAWLSLVHGDRFLAGDPQRRIDAVLCWVFALISAFSMANGVLVWPILVLAAALRKRWIFAATNLVAFVLLALFYFLPSIGSSTAFVEIGAPIPDWDFFQFWMVYLANPLGKTSFTLATLFGAVSLLVFAAGAYLCLSRDAKQRAAALQGAALLWMAGFVGLSGFMTTLARVDRGLINATSERYTTGALLLVAALFVYLLTHWKMWSACKWGRPLVGVWLAFAVFYTGDLLTKQNFYLFHYGIQYQHKKIALNALQNGCLDDAFSSYLYPDLRRHLPALKTLVAQCKSAENHALPSTISLPEHDQTLPVEEIASRAILRNDFEGRPSKLVFYGSLRVADDIVHQRLFFTDAKGVVLGSGFGVRRFPDHAPFDHFRNTEGHQLFYAHGDRAMLSEETFLSLERSGAFELLGIMPPPQLENQHLAPILRFPQTGLKPVTLHGVEHSPHWKPNGGFPGVPVPEGIENVWGSWTGSDAHTGWIELQMEVPPGSRQILVPYLSGPSIPGARIQMRAIGAPDEIKEFHLPASSEHWSLVPFELRSEAQRVFIRIEDDGSNWGQWIAIATPFVK